MRMDIKRTALNITTYCNLNCKHCLAFIPYYDKRFMMSAAEAADILAIFFGGGDKEGVVDSTEHFTVTGGEPLLNKDCIWILKELFKYEKQILKSVDLVTNGTMEIPGEILDLLEEHKDKARVVLSNYGETLSTKMEKIEADLKNRKIKYRVSKFWGNDLYYDGWIDFSDHSLKWKTKEERDNNAQKCIHRVGKYFVINEGELHCCSRSFWRMKKGIIPKVQGEYVPLLDKSITTEKKRKMLQIMIEAKSSTSCAHCVGLSNEVPRVAPAQQLPKSE